MNQNMLTKILENFSGKIKIKIWIQIQSRSFLSSVSSKKLPHKCSCKRQKLVILDFNWALCKPVTSNPNFWEHLHEHKHCLNCISKKWCNNAEQSWFFVQDDSPSCCMQQWQLLSWNLKAEEEEEAQMWQFWQFALCFSMRGRRRSEWVVCVKNLHSWQHRWELQSLQLEQDGSVRRQLHVSSRRKDSDPVICWWWMDKSLVQRPWSIWRNQLLQGCDQVGMWMQKWRPNASRQEISDRRGLWCLFNHWWRWLGKLWWWCLAC